MNEVSFSHFQLRLREIEATSSGWLLANQFGAIVRKTAYCMWYPKLTMQVTTMPFSITATHYQAKKRQKLFFLGNSHFEDLKHAATTYQKRHRYVNLRDWHSIAGTTTALKIVDHYSKKNIHSRHRYLPHADVGITKKWRSLPSRWITCHRLSDYRYLCFV